MSSIIVPKTFGQETYPFLEILRSPAIALELNLAVCSALNHSLKIDERQMGKSFVTKIKTQAEIRSRSGIMLKWYRTMRCECGYSHQRAIDHLYKALRAELDGGKFEPPKAEGMYLAAPSMGDA